MLKHLLQLAAALAFGLLLAVAFPARADLVLKNKENSNELRLYESACVNAETLGHLNPEWRDKFKAAKILTAKGHIAYFGCWIQHDEESVFVLLQDGSQSLMELSAFKDPSI